MVKVLPFVLIPILILSALGYWRFVYLPKQSLTATSIVQNLQPVEVPKSLPGTSVEDRIRILEGALAELAKRVNSLSGQQTGDEGTINSRLNSIEASVTDLKVQVSNLGQDAPSVVSSNSISYIPLGSGGSWNYSSWTTLTDFQINLDPVNFPGYSSMVLEVIFRVVDPTSTVSVRLHNTSDNTVVSSEISTSSSSFVLSSSTSFSLSSGSKTYVLQAKNSSDKTFFIQLARLRVNY